MKLKLLIVSIFMSTSIMAYANTDEVDLFLRKMASMTRAKTKCYFIQLRPDAVCDDYAYGHATMKSGTPLSTICAEAKRSAKSPPGCQRKHCTPCTYD